MKKLTDFCENLKYSKNVRKYGLLLSYDEKNKPILHIGDQNGSVYIKKFQGRFELDKFLIEAVILRLSCHNKDIKQVKDIYNNLINFMNDEERVSQNAIM